jgi:hypothetical protein
MHAASRECCTVWMDIKKRMRHLILLNELTYDQAASSERKLVNDMYIE